MSLPLLFLFTLLALTSFLPSTTAGLTSPLLRNLIPSPSPLSPSPSAVGASSCVIGADWSVPFNSSSARLVTGLSHFFPGPCLLLAYLYDSRGSLGTLQGVDIATGRVRWTEQLLDARDRPLNSFGPLLFNDSTGDLYFTKKRLQGDSSTFCDVTMAGAVLPDGSGVKWRWSTEVCSNHPMEGASTSELLQFPVGQGQTVLLNLGGWYDFFDGDANVTWTAIDAASGRVLQQQTNLGGFDSATVRGDPAQGYFLVNDEDTSSLYHMAANGNWSLVQSTGRLRERFFGARGLTVLNQQGSTLSGLDLRTGQQAWSVSNDSLVTGAWTANFTGFNPFPGQPTMLQHPTEPNLVLRNAWAFGGQTAQVIFLADLFNVTSGMPVAAMAHPELFAGSSGGEQEVPGPQLVDGVIVFHLGLASGAQWLALDAQSMQLVSTGAFGREDFWTSVNATSASVVFQQFIEPAGLVGQTLKADPASTDSEMQEAAVGTWWERMLRGARQ